MTTKGFTIRHFAPDDYEMVLAWWKGHDWEGVPESILPRPGIVAEYGGKPVAAVWLYLSNSNGVGMMEWLVVKPGLPPRQSLAAIKALMDGIEIECRTAGYNIIFTSCKQPGLVRILGSHGFLESDKEMIHMLKILPPTE